MIEHLITTGNRIREGTSDAAGKKRAWEELRKVFNAQARAEGQEY